MSGTRNPDILQYLVAEAREHVRRDIVGFERIGVLRHAKRFQPLADFGRHPVPPSVQSARNLPREEATDHVGRAERRSLRIQPTHSNH